MGKKIKNNWVEFHRNHIPYLVNIKRLLAVTPTGIGTTEFRMNDGLTIIIDDSYNEVKRILNNLTNT